MRKTLPIIVSSLVALVLVGCAKMGQPDGGWYDETPPHVVATFPQEFATGVKAKKITLLFDEYIQLDNPTEKVVISPPQLEAPDIKAGANRITVQLNDSLVPATTYTIDFSDAISDNNEGNPMGNYTYSFSTGGNIDTLEVAGYVVEAENMEPVKGILVGLHTCLDDSAFTTTPLERVARTDSRGRFVVRGVAPGSYRVYALQDADGNYMLSQKSEKLAFSHQVIEPSCKPDVRQDTLWSDSLHIGSIERVGYTHFLPDDIVLKAFTEIQTDRYLIKSERSMPERLSLFYSYGHSDLPRLHGLNFDDRDAFVLEQNEMRDTLHYWLRDTLLIQQDSLQIELTYEATDTMGVLRSQTDTLLFMPKTPYAKRQKDLEKEREKWEKEQEKAKKKGAKYETEMPVAPLEVKMLMQSDMMPDGAIVFETPTPLALADTSKIRLFSKQDTLLVEKAYTLTPLTCHDGDSIATALRRLRLRPDSAGQLWTPATQYVLQLDSAAFTDIYGKASKAEKKGFAVKSEEDFATVVFHVARLEEAPYVGQLIDSSEKMVRQTTSDTGDLTFEYVKPGDYYLRVFADANANGIWDTGDYEDNRQAESVYYYPEKIECKAHWPFERSWNPADNGPTRLKPGAITKQKADKTRQIKSRNTQRAQKMGIQYIPKTK